MPLALFLLACVLFSLRFVAPLFRPLVPSSASSRAYIACCFLFLLPFPLSLCRYLSLSLLLLYLISWQRSAFRFWIPQWKWLQRFGRKIGFIPLMFSGIWGIPYAMPGPTPLNVVVAKPILVPKMTGVLTEEMLRPYHAQFVEAIERIFENNKEQFGMGKVVLKII
jgi:hypothetical protein